MKECSGRDEREENHEPDCNEPKGSLHVKVCVLSL
jgi:hypothetical protein